MKQRSILSRIASGFLLALIATFAITTMGNVADFVHRYHAGWTGWTLGAAFGVTVFLSSYIAATASTKRTRRIALLISVVFALSSGFFQVDLYVAGNAPLTTAFILAFVPITIGEAGLALLESSYSKDHEAEQERLLSDDLRAQVDELKSVLQSERNDMETERASLRNLTARNAQLQARIEQLQTQSAQVSPQPQPQAQDVPAVNADDISDSQVEIIRVIANNPQLQQKEIADATGKSATAISRQLKPLKDGGMLEFDGATWNLHPQLVAQLNGKLSSN